MSKRKKTNSNNGRHNNSGNDIKRSSAPYTPPAEGERVAKSSDDIVKSGNTKRPVQQKYSRSFASDVRAWKPSAYNDVSWYAKSPQLVKDTASFPFNLPTGARLSFGDSEYVNTNVVETLNARYAPGILTIDILPHLGIAAGNGNDPVNIAASSIYSYVVHANSRNTTYSRADLMLVLGAADSVFSFINMCQRLYGIIMNPNQWNRYQAADLVRANGFSFTDFQANIANFRAWLNQFINKASFIWVPNTLPIFKKHSWMFANVYKDHDNANCQLYMFRPAGFYVYDETSSEQGGYLKFNTDIIPKFSAAATGANKVTDGSLTTFSSLQRFGNLMIQKLIDSEDVQTIFADIRKAYTAEGLYRLAEVDESYKIDPTYNTEVLFEISNLFAVPAYYETTGTFDSSFNITQDPNTQNLIFQPLTYMKHGGYAINRLLNFGIDNPTPEDVLVATRLTASIDPETLHIEGGYVRAKFLSAGTELVTGMRIWGYGYQKSGEKYLYMTDQFYSILVSTIAGNAFSQQSMRLINMLESFDWHPPIYVGTTTGTLPDVIPTFTLYSIATDMANMCFLTNSELAQMDETAILSEFDVPLR